MYQNLTPNQVKANLQKPKILDPLYKYVQGWHASFPRAAARTSSHAGNLFCPLSKYFVFY
jgi:hypothetical protein